MLGLVRESTIAYLFGATGNVSAFRVAATLVLGLAFLGIKLTQEWGPDLREGLVPGLEPIIVIRPGRLGLAVGERLELV